MSPCRTARTSNLARFLKIWEIRNAGESASRLLWRLGPRGLQLDSVILDVMAVPRPIDDVERPVLDFVRAHGLDATARPAR